MSKFDALLTSIKENIPVNNTTNQQAGNNQAANNNQTNKPTTTPSTPNNNNQQKPNLDQLMKDFNDPNKKINNLADLKNYGINID